MSTVPENQNVWSVKENVNSKYEKCLNITEEIYKRINITFEIKKLENEAQSDVSNQSDQIDSNELSNETDLFACDKSSLSSSTEAEKPAAKFININNNEEKPRPVVVNKRLKKRFRKRVKKRQSKQQSDSDGSSDEALPLSRIIDINIDKCVSEGQESPDNVMGVPNILILAKDSKPKIQQEKAVKSETEKPVVEEKKEIEPAMAIDTTENVEVDKVEKVVEMKNCTMCNLPFRGERGLRRHVSMSHVSTIETKAKTGAVPRNT